MGNKILSAKKIDLNFGAAVLLLALIPASVFILRIAHEKSGWVLMPGFDSLNFPPRTPISDSKKTNLGSPETLSKRADKVQLMEDGSILKETFDVSGRRISKNILSPEGILLSRWDFEPASKRILRFEVNEYQGTQLTQRRVAHYQYAGDGGFVKTNQFFDTKAGIRKSFVESVNSKEIKYKEEWFDEKKRLVAKKLWDFKTGNFVSYFMTEYSLGGWSTRTYLDEKGNSVSRVVLTPHGKNFNSGVIPMGEKGAVL